MIWLKSTTAPAAVHVERPLKWGSRVGGLLTLRAVDNGGRGRALDQDIGGPARRADSVGRREIGYLFGQYKRLSNRYASVFSPGRAWPGGGSQVRQEATGYGTVFFVNEMLRARGETFDGRRVVVSGLGNVAIHAIEKVHQLGGIVITCSDSDGYVVDEKGIDAELLKQIKEVRRARVRDYAEARGSMVDHVAGGTIWDVPCDVTSPCRRRRRTGSTVPCGGVGPVSHPFHRRRKPSPQVDDDLLTWCAYADERGLAPDVGDPSGHGTRSGPL